MRQSGGISLVKWIIGLTIVVIFVLGVLPNLSFTPPQDADLPDYSSYFPLHSTNTNDSVEYVPITDEEWREWMNGIIKFRVDVTVPTSHAWLRHGEQDAKNALKCVTENGVSVVLGEFSNRNLHLLCTDREGNEYVVVINELKRSKDPYKNTHSYLNTAFRLKKEYGENIEDYVDRMTNRVKRAKLVPMRFLPEEIYFMPY